MKVLIFYKVDSETRRQVDEFVHEFKRRYPDQDLDLIDVDTIHGSQEADIYDIVQYPSVIATSNDGATLQRWDPGQMPLMNEVAYYSNQ
jgi:methyl coenzyme M reductase alpha subunit